MHLIETTRLIIRPFSMEDLQDVHNILDMEQGDFGTKGCMSLQQREKWLEWTILGYEQYAILNQPPYGERAVVEKTSNKLIGVCGSVPCLDRFDQLNEARETLATAEFGLFYAISKDFQGLGYATEASRAMIDWAFEHLHIKRIIATTTYDNEASIKVMHNLGMELKKNQCSTPAWLQVVGVLNNPFMSRKSHISFRGHTHPVTDKSPPAQ